MTISQILINNLSNSVLSLDVRIADDRQIRRTLRIGESIDVTSECTLEELNINPTMLALRGVSPSGTPKVSVTTVAGTNDLAGETTQVVSALEADTDSNLSLSAPGAGKTVTLSAVTKTDASAALIGAQCEPTQGASTAYDVIGMEISPRLASAVALTGTANLVGFHVDATLQGATGDVAGDVRGQQIEVADGAGSTRTVAGDLVGLRFASSVESTVTGDAAVLSVEAAAKATGWDFFLKAADEGATVSTGTAATQAGVIAVKIGSATKYIALYDAVS